MNQESGLVLGSRGGWKKWLLLALLVAALASGAVAMLKSRNDAPAGPVYVTKEALQGDLTVTVTATGDLQPVNQVEVGTEVSGTVASVEADYNDPVRKDQVLARLDLTKLNAEAEQSRALMASARALLSQRKANLAEQKAKLARMQEANRLSGGKIPSRFDLEQAVAGVDQVSAQVEAAQASIAEARARLAVDETNLTKAVIRSPIDGVVLTRSVEPGQTVAASLQAPVLFVLADDLSRMTLYVDVDEADVGRVRAGQRATFTVDAYPDRNFSAKVIQVRLSPTTESGVVTYQTLLSVDNPDLSLMPGMTATADIVVQEVNEALLIPNAALRFRPPSQSAETQKVPLLSRLFPGRPPIKRRQGNVNKTENGGATVYVENQGRAEAISIMPGPSDGRSTQVLSGDIKPGDLLITDVDK